MLAQDIKAGQTITTEYKRVAVDVRVTEATQNNGIVCVWFKTPDAWKKGQECKFYQVGEEV